MVNTVNGQGHGNPVPLVQKSDPALTLEENTEPVQQSSHPGKGKAGAPGQLAKQMLGGTPPVGFALGNLVSLIAQGDLDAAQDLANQVNPPPAEDPVTNTDTEEVAVIVDPAELPADIGEGVDAEVAAVAAAAAAADDSAVDEENEAVVVAAEEPVLILDPDSEEDPSILDLFDGPVNVDETV